MVTTTALHSAEQMQLTAGLSSDDGARVLDALAYVRPMYASHTVKSGQLMMDYVQGMATILSLLNCDAQTRIAGLLAEMPGIDPKATDVMEARFGEDVVVLVNSIRQLLRLRELTSGPQEVLRGKNAAQQAVGGARLAAARREAPVAVDPTGLVVADIVRDQDVADALPGVVDAERDADGDDGAGPQPPDGVVRRRPGAQAALFADEVQDLHAAVDAQVIDGKSARGVGRRLAIGVGETVQHRVGFMPVEGDEHHGRAEDHAPLLGLPQGWRDGVQIAGVGKGWHAGLPLAPNPAAGRSGLLVGGDPHRQWNAPFLRRFVEGGEQPVQRGVGAGWRAGREQVWQQIRHPRATVFREVFDQTNRKARIARRQMWQQTLKPHGCEIAGENGRHGRASILEGWSILADPPRGVNRDLFVMFVCSLN